jgi:hypothetical protein
MMNSFLSGLIILVGTLVIALSYRYLFVNRRIAFAAGWALARWVSGEPWRPPAFCALLGLVALGVAAWSVKLNEPAFFFLFLLALVICLKGLTGFAFDYTDETGGEPGSWNEGWWRRSRF